MGWKFKFCFILLVYIAGFSTGIYFLAPNPKNVNLHTATQTVGFESALTKEGINLSEAQKQQFIRIYNAGLHKGVAISKNTFCRMKDYINLKIEQRNQRKFTRAD